MTVPKSLRPIWKLVTSLKFAILVMVAIMCAMIVATILESYYDTPTSQYFVYQSKWFYGVLTLFGLNILCVALSRLPWKPRHIPFLLAHLGILVLLYGSWLTYQFGIDGNLSVQEGTEESVVELNDPQLLVADASEVRSYPIGWRPTFMPFHGINVPEYQLRVSKWFTHAESDQAFVAGDLATPAVHLKILGGPKSPPFMRRGQDLWLWTGDIAWSIRQLGPAVLQLVSTAENPFPTQRPALQLRFDADKKILLWHAKGSDGSDKTGEIPVTAEWTEEKPITIDPGWKNDVRVNFFAVVPRARMRVIYRASVLESGQGAPESAIFVEPTTADGKALPPDANGEPRGVWLGMGEKARLDSGARHLQIGYFPRRLILPFGLTLNQFKIDAYPGSNNPMSFSSNVSIRGALNDEGKPLTDWIRMNEPLKHGGFTFYQASYVPDQPRPTVSIFSVNRDPGRWVKYIGAILLVLGAILFFLQKLRTQNAQRAAALARKGSVS